MRSFTLSSWPGMAGAASFQQGCLARLRAANSSANLQPASDRLLVFLSMATLRKTTQKHWEMLWQELVSVSDYYLPDKVFQRWWEAGGKLARAAWCPTERWPAPRQRPNRSEAFCLLLGSVLFCQQALMAACLLSVSLSLSYSQGCRRYHYFIV